MYQALDGRLIKVTKIGQLSPRMAKKWLRSPNGVGHLIEVSSQFFPTIISQL